MNPESERNLQLVFGIGTSVVFGDPESDARTGSLAPEIVLVEPGVSLKADRNGQASPGCPGGGWKIEHVLFANTNSPQQLERWPVYVRRVGAQRIWRSRTMPCQETTNKERRNGGEEVRKIDPLVFIGNCRGRFTWTMDTRFCSRLSFILRQAPTKEPAIVFFFGPTWNFISRYLGPKCRKPVGVTNPELIVPICLPHYSTLTFANHLGRLNRCESLGSLQPSESVPVLTR